MKEIILPINEEDCLKSYTHNAFISSILLSDEVGGDVAARYKILTNTRERQVIDGNCQTEIGPEVTVRADHYKINGYSAVYWDCKKDDRLIIHILSRRRISSWERISLIVDDKISPDTFKPAKCLARFGCPSNQNLFVKRREEFLAHEDLKRILPVSYYLKLEKTDLKLNYSYSLDGKKWHEVYLDTLPDKYALSPLSIGILVETRNNYMNWFAANYIQMGLTPVVGGSRMADYCFGLIKNYRPYFTNQFMDFYIEYMDPDDYSCRKMTDWVYNKLSERFYLITSINHFYIKDTEFYGRSDHFHEVMIYGINKKKRQILLMGYNELDMVKLFKISFLDFRRSLNTNQIQFMLGRINPNYGNFLLNSSIIKRRLRDYLDGRNSTMDYEDINPRQPHAAYGIDVLKTLIRDDVELFAFCRETRLSYAIYEHKLLMLERIKYLVTNGFMGNNMEEIGRVLSLAESNLKLTEMIKNNILMSEMFMNKRTTMEKIKGYLQKLIDSEIITYELICKNLID